MIWSAFTYVSKFIKKSQRKDACEESNFTNLYVKKLSEDVTEDFLRTKFSEYGNVSAVVIMKDSAGKSKGFGFVGYKAHTDAKKAMETLNGAVIGSKKLYVGKAGEFIGILVFAVFIIWITSVYIIQDSKKISMIHSLREQSIWMLEFTGLRFGLIGLFCLAFLFLPVSRGSVLLRLIDIPFEHAARYHVLS